MSAYARVERARRVLAAAVGALALLWGATAAMAIVALAAAARLVIPLPPFARLAIVPLAVGAALAGAATVAWRGRAVRSIGRVALWIEEHDPSLRYALVTAADPAAAPASEHPALHAAAAAAQVERLVRSTTTRALALALLGLALAALALFALHPRDLLSDAGAALRRGVGLGGAPAVLGNRLAAFSARVVPPAYARQPSITIAQPLDVAALVGSRVTFAGRGPADGVVGAVGADTIQARSGDGTWEIATTMPLAPAVVTLRDRDYRRLVTLDPRPDSAPELRLALPASDTTYQRVPTGTLLLEARLTDDVGLAYGYFEYLLSTGAEENFQTKLTTSRRVAFGNARGATLREVVRFDTLKLGPGSVLHVRAVAYDYNDVTGPGRGVSETRTLRVAEPLDSVSVNAAPPLPIDTLWVSQRLLNMRTDTLLRTRSATPRGAFVAKSSGYANTQEGIRQRVLAVIALLEADGVGGSFATETSTKLREVADMMFTARTDLGIAQPDSAMPVMRRILKILDELRLAHRFYLRGILKPVPVNVERTRLTGKDSAAAAARSPRTTLADAKGDLLARVDAAALAAATSPAAAADSLTFIRVKALSIAPAAAAALQRAIADIAQGVTPASALAPVRRALAPRPRVVASPAGWTGVLP